MDRLTLSFDNGVARLTLARPEKYNAFDDQLIIALTEALVQLSEDAKARVLVLAAEGSAFSAGADLKWMKIAATASREQNIADARKLARLMRLLDEFPKPTIAAIQGPAYGGGVGLISCCDIAIASTKAKFAFSEVKLGLIPAVIGPYVIAAIGPRQARRYFQTAETFDCETAKNIGLIHEIVSPEDLDTRVCAIGNELMRSAPGACREAKRFVREVTYLPFDDALSEKTSVRIAEIRADAEAQIGIASFLSRSPPVWIPRKD